MGLVATAQRSKSSTLRGRDGAQLFASVPLAKALYPELSLFAMVCRLPCRARRARLPTSITAPLGAIRQFHHFASMRKLARAFGPQSIAQSYMGHHARGAAIPHEFPLNTLF